MNKITKIEGFILLGLALLFQFTAVNVNPTLGHIYAAFTAFTAIFILLDTKRTIPLKKSSESTFGSIAWGAGAFIFLTVLGNFIIVPGVSAVRRLLGATTPVLASNPLLNNVIFGVGVPLAETMFFFAICLDFVASLTNIQVNKQSLKKMGLWTLIIVFSLIFMLFHLTAKGITNIEVLTIVFFMAMISLVLIAWREDYEAALYFHIIANLSALLL